MTARLIRAVTAVALTTIAGALVLAACTSGDGSDGGDVPCIDTSGVPELQDGILTVGSSFNFEPITFVDAETAAPNGLDIDLAAALARSLCVDVEFATTDFGDLIDAVNTAEFDVIMSAMTITDERSQDIDFIPYANVGTAILVRAGNPTEARGLADLCGLAVAVQRETIQVGQLEEQSRDCIRNEDASIDILQFDTNPVAVTDLVTAGSDASISDFPVAFVDEAESNGRLELLEEQIAPLPYGIGVRKDSTTLNSVLTEALNDLIDSGTYESTLDAWSLANAALE
jgi:polar amino acid transport system substrate-binding protein